MRKGVHDRVHISGAIGLRLAARRRPRRLPAGRGKNPATPSRRADLHKQLTLHGSWVCGINEMGDLLEHLERKGLHPDSTVTHTFSLSDTKDAYETFYAGKTGKVVIVWEDA